MRKLLLLALTLALLCTGCRGEGGPSDDGGNHTEVDPNWQNRVEYDGVEYRRRTDVKTILFLGVDNAYTSEFGAGLVGNNGRSDVIMLFVVDTKTKTTELLTVSRDTITEVDVYDGLGELQYSAPMQITLQYSFGNSAKRSCFLTQRTVSELLYDTRIDGYFSLTMDGIPVIVEELGGVTLTLPEDYSYIDPAYTKGATVTLDGDAAERFIRYRDITVMGSNETRSQRLTFLATEVFRQIKNVPDLEEAVNRLMSVAGDYIETDLDGETLKLLAGSTVTETCKVPGEVVEGELHNEYHVDEQGLRELVIRLFYRPV